MFFDKDGSEMWCGHEHQLQTWFREIKIVQHCTSFQHSFRGYWMILCDIFNHPDWLHPQFDLYHFKTEKGSNWSQVGLKLVTSWSAENQVTSGSSQSKITNLNYICITNLTLKSFIHPALKREDRLGKDPFAGFVYAVKSHHQCNQAGSPRWPWMI